VSFGVPQISQTLQVTNLIPSPVDASFSATTSTGQPWLAVSPPSQSIQPGISASLNVTVTTTGLTAGTYSGTIVITDHTSASQSISVPVTLNYGSATGNSVLNANPNPLNISLPAGAALQFDQQLTITSASAVSFATATATASGLNWLTVTPFSANISPVQPV